ncbi:hypothetical protein GCM10025793_16750 [Lysobacter lycopersici]
MATTVLALRDVALEAGIPQRMVFDLHCHALYLRIETRAFRNSPTLQGVADLEAEVVVAMARMVQLNDKDRTPAWPEAGRANCGLRRLSKLTLAGIFLKHGRGDSNSARQ